MDDPKAMLEECKRRKRVDIEALGPRPGWWRPIARADYDDRIREIRRKHNEDLMWILEAKDPQDKHLRAVLLGYEKFDPSIIL